MSSQAKYTSAEEEIISKDIPYTLPGIKTTLGKKEVQTFISDLAFKAH